MNLASSSGKANNLSFLPFAAKIVKEEGVLSLYNGLPAGILRQVHSSLQPSPALPKRAASPSKRARASRPGVLRHVPSRPVRGDARPCLQVQVLQGINLPNPCPFAPWVSIFARTSSIGAGTWAHNGCMHVQARIRLGKFMSAAAAAAAAAQRKRHFQPPRRRRRLG